MGRTQLAEDAVEKFDVDPAAGVAATSAQVLGLPPGVFVDPGAGAAPQIVAVLAPQRVDRCLCEFRHIPNVIKGSPGQTPQSIRDWLNRREPAWIDRATIAVRVVDANRDDAAGIRQLVVV